MNELHSDPDYRPRWAGHLLRDRLAAFPVVVVTGPRQTGKTWLVRNEAPVDDYRFSDLDDLEVRARVEDEPGYPWTGTDSAVVDEVQRVPRVLEALKSAVDRREALRVVLTGSANLLLMKGVCETLAGRAAYLELLPAGAGEWAGREPPVLLDDLLAGRLPPDGGGMEQPPAPEIHRGLLPAARVAPDVVTWWDAYVRTYLERDLRDLSSVQSLPDFRRVMALLALGSGIPLNETEISRKVSVSQPTVHRYVNLLETSHLGVRIPAWTVNRGKRVARRPKLYLADPGLQAFLCGLFTPDDVESSREAGLLFETLVLHHLRLLASHLRPPGQVHHWRTADGREVDFVLSHGRRLVAFECKWTARPRAAHARHLRFFRELHPECAAGVVVHAGSGVERLGRRLVGLPWTVLAGL